ncbi:MAG TPA: universal stress protein [Aestuariivirgaceae bacterium]|jgi:nucleotide-binding universal stress UspA family protein
MSYKTILVSLNEIDRLDTLVELTAKLALKYDAHVLGLYVIPAAAVYPAVGPYVAPEIFDSFTKFFEDQSKKVKQKFETVMKRNSLASQWLEVRALVPMISDTISEIGRIADLIVLSETDRNASQGVELNVVENTIMSAGRPVLVIPRKAEGDLKVSQIVCGYNGSKEAARAVHDALPFLKMADDVRLVWVDPSKESEMAGSVPGSDMAESLDRHGVRATAESMPTNGINPAEALVTRARDLGAGMVVMGAYGHSRLREFVLGGATKQALSAMTVPLIMSH